MKPEPLKNKLLCLKHSDKNRVKNCKWIAYEIDIKSAVEWAKEKLYKRFGHELHGDREIQEIMNKAFEDIMK